MLSALVALTLAHAAPDDLAVTSVGAQGVYDQGLAVGDVDLLVGERFRWTLADRAFATVALADARFTLDPAGGDPWEQNRVRQLGVELAAPAWLVTIGRHPVVQGGPRLVDGVQVVGRRGAWRFGGWAGLAPDLFTTRPMLRPGGGPIVAVDTPLAQASLVGEVLGTATGLDRVGLLAQTRVSRTPTWELLGRLDLQLTDADGTFGLADGFVAGKVRPGAGFTFDALYDAYSSIRYLETQLLDPDLQRYEARAEALGLVDLTPEDLVDPSLYHLVGGGAAWQGTGLVIPRVAVVGRYRHATAADDRYARVGPQVGLIGLADRVDLYGDFVWSWRGSAGARDEVGLNVVVDPMADGRLALDGSFRLLIDPVFAGRAGWYTDLFVDLAAVDQFVLVGGLSATNEPSDVTDAGLAGFLRVQHRLQRPRREPAADDRELAAPGS